jgi:hypothetical protein
MPTTEYLLKYYAQYYSDKARKVTFSGDLRFAQHIIGMIPSGQWGDVVRILDFGSGDGSLARAIAQCLLSEHARRYVQLLLVDFQPPVDFSDQRVTVRYKTTFEEIEGEYDLVLASAILEHTPDLNPVIRCLFAATARQGYFYARTPFVVPFSRIAPNLDITFPGHVHDLGSSFWNHAADTFQFKARYVASRPSVVATTWRADPFRSLAAYVLKLPGHVEGALSPPHRKERFWNLVGGWEVLLQRD